MVRRSVLAVVAILTMVLGTMVAATSSGAILVARSLPSGDSMFAIQCNGTPGQLNSVDSVTAAFTPIGSSQNIDGSSCGFGMAYNPITLKSYVLAGNNSSGEWPIVEVDLTSGAQTEISRITINGSAATGFPAVMTFDASGNAYAIVQNNFYALDISTGNATLRGAVGTVSDIYAMTMNPRDEVVYAMGEGGELVSIDVGTGAGTSIVDLQLFSGVYSLQFDSNGIGWLNVGVNSLDAISSFDLTNPQATLVDSSADATHYSGAYLIVWSVPPTPPSSTTTSTTTSSSTPVVPAFTG